MEFNEEAEAVYQDVYKEEFNKSIDKLIDNKIDTENKLLTLNDISDRYIEKQEYQLRLEKIINETRTFMSQANFPAFYISIHLNFDLI